MDKIRRFLFCSLVALLAALPVHTQKESRIKIVYIGFADNLVVDSGRLNHSFAQHSSFARSAALQLSAGQMQFFKDWLDRCQVLSLTAPDVMVSDPDHPGAEEFNSLLVEYGDKKIDLSWRGVSRWKDAAQKELLDKALAELTQLSIRLLREASLL